MAHKRCDYNPEAFCSDCQLCCVIDEDESEVTE